MNEAAERDVRVARANVERDIARLGDVVEEQVRSKAVVLVGSAAVVGLLVGTLVGRALTKKKARAA